MACSRRVGWVVGSALLLLATGARAQAPTINCVQSTVQADPTTCLACPSYGELFTVSPANASCTVSPDCTQEPFGLGINEYSVNCCDSAGCSSTACPGVQVVSNAPPPISCPPMTVECGQPPPLPQPVVGDACYTVATQCSMQMAPGAASGSYSCTATLINGALGEPSSSCVGAVQVSGGSGPPVVTVGATPVLWPPNHKYHLVTLQDCQVSAVDSCGVPLDVAQAGLVTRVESNEPEDVRSGPALNGDGHTCNDMVIVGNTAVLVRAERAGTYTDRVYTLYFTVGTNTGAFTPGTCRVIVPHDPSGRHAYDTTCRFCVGEACGGCPTHDPACTYGTTQIQQ